MQTKIHIDFYIEQTNFMHNTINIKDLLRITYSQLINLVKAETCNYIKYTQILGKIFIFTWTELQKR